MIFGKRLIRTSGNGCGKTQFLNRITKASIIFTGSKIRIFINFLMGNRHISLVDKALHHILVVEKQLG